MKVKKFMGISALANAKLVVPLIGVEDSLKQFNNWPTSQRCAEDVCDSLEDFFRQANALPKFPLVPSWREIHLYDEVNRRGMRLVHMRPLSRDKNSVGGWAHNFVRLYSDGFGVKIVNSEQHNVELPNQEITFFRAPRVGICPLEFYRTPFAACIISESQKIDYLDEGKYKISPYQVGGALK